MAKRRIAQRIALGVLLAVAAAQPACRRSRGRSAAPNTSTSVIDARDVRCVERPEGCIWCEGRGGPTPPLVEPDAIPPSLCDPKDPGDCVDFCSRLTPECAVPWRTVPSCLLPTEQEFRREIFRRDTADRPEAFVQGPNHRRGRPPRRRGQAPRLVPGDGHPRRGLGQGRQLPGPPAGRPVDLLGPGEPRRAGHRDRRPAHRSGRNDGAQLSPGAGVHHPRPRRQHGGRSDRRGRDQRRSQPGRSGRRGRDAEPAPTGPSSSPGST